MRYCQKGLHNTIGYIIKRAWNEILPKGFTIGYGI